MRRNLATLAAVLATALLIAFALHRRPHGAPLPEATHDPPTSPEVLTAVPIEMDHKVGAGRSFGDLTVFPILAEEQPDLGPFITLEQALEAKTAEVREASEGGRVNSLVIENKGKTSIFVLAGTVVKGGKQDRQIAQDFAVGPQQTMAVDAYCVERRRWNAARNGVATEGKFGTSKTLAVSSVRAAGQYKKNQGEVWSKVGEVNAANGKDSPTDTLMASLDDKEIAGKRASLAQQVAGFIDTLEPQREVVGIAYAVDGRVRGVRWFANHQLYAMYRDTLFNTAAVEAVTAQRAAGGRPKTDAPAPTPDAVRAFVSEIESTQVTEERATPGQNVNSYKESKLGYGSSSTLKAAPTAWAQATAAPAAPDGTSNGTASAAAAPISSARMKRAMTISSDFTAK